VKDVREKLAEKSAEAFVITALDEVACRCFCLLLPCFTIHISMPLPTIEFSILCSCV